MENIENSTSSVSTDCLYYVCNLSFFAHSWFGEAVFGTSIHIFYQKAIFTAIEPFACVFLAVLFWAIYFAIRRKKLPKGYLSSRIWTSTIIILFNMQTSLIDLGFSFFK